MQCYISDASVLIDIEVGGLTEAMHGTIWVVQEMCSHQKVSLEIAEVAFERMRVAGSRLPWGEVERFLRGGS